MNEKYSLNKLYPKYQFITFQIQQSNVRRRTAATHMNPFERFEEKKASPMSRCTNLKWFMPGRRYFLLARFKTLE